MSEIIQTKIGTQLKTTIFIVTIIFHRIGERCRTDNDNIHPHSASSEQGAVLGTVRGGYETCNVKSCFRTLY